MIGVLFVPLLSKAVTAWCGSVHSTLVVENLFNAIRRLERGTSNSRVVAARAWHESMCSQVLPEYNMELAVISDKARAVAPAKVPGTVYVGGPSSSSLDKKALRPLTDAVASWPNQAPFKSKGRGVKWKAALAAEGSWQKLADTWPSLMLSPGDWALDGVSKKAFLVLKATAHGFLSLDTQIKKINGRLVLAFPPWHPDAVRVRSVTDHGQWRVATLDVVGPLSAVWQSGRVHPGFHLVVPGKGVPLQRPEAHKNTLIMRRPW